jgi:chromate transporter
VATTLPPAVDIEARGGAAPSPTLAALFAGFLWVSMHAFGGVLPWARRMLVEDRRWLSPDEFVETLAFCQFLPGPNIVNMSIAVGAKFRGVPGALAGFLGLMAVPFCLVIAVGVFYAHYGDHPSVRGAFTGVAAAAAGLLTATAAKMAMPMLERRFVKAAPFLAVAFIAVALMRVPLHWVILVLAPLSIAASWRWRR